MSLQITVSLATLPFLQALLLAALATSPTHADLSPEQLADALRPHVEAGRIAGAVALVGNKNGVVAATAYGDANAKTKESMRDDHVFWIASMTKPITATAVMMLVDEGKLSLDDPVEKHLPEFRHTDEGLRDAEQRAVGAGITIRQLLSHTSGLPSRATGEHVPLDQRPLDAAAELCARTPLQSAPGARHHYTNCGFTVAGRIVEVVGKQPYAEFLEQRLFRPLGMNETTFWPTEEQAARLATAYRRDDNAKELVEFDYPQMKRPIWDRETRYAYPGGGLYSTAADLAKFCRLILLNGEIDGVRYLSEKSIREMTSNQTEGVGRPYGLGWAVTKNGRSFGHGGALQTRMWLYPPAGQFVVYLVQSGTADEGGDASPFRSVESIAVAGAASDSRDVSTAKSTVGAE